MGRSTSLNKPAAMRGMPEPPAGMSRAGRELWARTLTVRPAAEWHAADAQLLALYIRAAEDVERLDRQIDKEGEVVLAGNGTPLVSPLVTLRGRREAVMLAVAKRLRLTPCSRYSAKDVGRLARHAQRAQVASDLLDGDDLLAGGRMQ